jgi:hypothetical protein
MYSLQHIENSCESHPAVCHSVLDALCTPVIKQPECESNCLPSLRTRRVSLSRVILHWAAVTRTVGNQNIAVSGIYKKVTPVLV